MSEFCPHTEGSEPKVLPRTGSLMADQVTDEGRLR